MWKRWLAIAGGGAVALLGHLAAVYLLLHGGDPVGAMVMAGMGGLALAGVVGFVARRGELVGGMVICAFIGSFAGAYTLDALRDLDRQLAPANVFRGVTPDGIHLYPPGAVVYLEASTLDTGRTGGAERARKRGGHTRFRVAPLVPPGWTPAEPVPAWAGFETNPSMVGGFSESDGLAEWARPSQAGFVLDRASDLKWDEAIADAERSHGLQSVAGAGLLRWRHPDDERRSRRNDFLFVLAMTQATWLLCVASSARRTARAAATS